MILILFLGLIMHSALNSNKLTGSIPPSLGKLSSVTWLDLADNLLTGPLPNSKDNGTGLDQLLEAEHLLVSQKDISFVAHSLQAITHKYVSSVLSSHFNRNNLEGSIPEYLFNSNMKLKHM
jgi:hypothetical protein